MLKAWGSALEIKICGITRLEDAFAALACGADYLGFVFFPGSVRAVTPEQVRRISGELPAGAQCVGVFVDVSAAAAQAIAVDCRLSAIQLHGTETARDFEGFPLPVWRAVRFCGGEPVPAPEEWPAARYVADSRAADGGHTGGSGKLTDWAAAACLARRVPVMLAGGLTDRNVAEAVANVRPQGVDTAGGVEEAGMPGCKNHEKIRCFIDAARKQ